MGFEKSSVESLGKDVVTSGLSPADDAFLDSLFQDVPERHDDIQIEHFIIQQNAHCSVWGTLRQCSLELRARRNALRTLRHELDQARFDYSEAGRACSSWITFFLPQSARHKRLLHKEALSWKVDQLVDKMKSVRYELDKILLIARKARRLAGNLADPVHARALLAEFWANKIGAQLDSCVQPNGIPGALHDILRVLPSDVNVKMVNPTTNSMKALVDK